MNNTPNQFIEDFKNHLNKVKNKEALIKNEIIQIEVFTSSKGGNPEMMGELNFANETNSVFDLMDIGFREFFNSVFNDYLINGKITCIPDNNEMDDDLRDFGISSLRDDECAMSEIEKATNFVDYYNWLKELEIKPTIQKDKSNLNLEQKLLALQYLGLEVRDFSNSHSATVLGQILNVGSENIRKNLSNLYAGKNKVRSAENLEKVSELFKNQTFDSISNRIKKELKEMK